MLTRREMTRTIAGAMTLGVGLTPMLRALAQDALDTLPDGPLREQVAWFVGLLNDPDTTVTEAELGEHFNEAFLTQVPASQMIGLIEQLKGQLRGVTITGISTGGSDSEAVVHLAGSTGVNVRMTIVVDPGSGLISGLLLQPGEPASGGDSDATPAVASPAASPPAVAPPPTTGEILPDYQAAVDALLAAGRELTGAFIAGDDETVSGLLSESVVAMLGGFSAQESMEELTTNIVSFAIAEVNAYFAGHYTTEGITGLYHQATPAAFQLTPDEPQTGDVPTGLWTGNIMIGSYTLGIEVTFSGTASDLAATISIPEQFLTDHPLTNVQFEAERPLGALLDERALPMGPSTGTSSYGALYEWGNAMVAINSAFDADNRAIALSPMMQMPLPDDPAADDAVTTSFRLPFDGAWMVIWGGDSEFRNYHASTPQQRYAHDIVIWRDGATYTGDGTRNEDYHCYGQPQYAPASGTVVVTVDEYPDDMPGSTPTTDPTMHPAGNHIVIEVTEGQYVLMAHFQPGSIVVAEGQTVAAGDLVGLTGNSGNSSEPHVHIHMQTGPDMFDPATFGLPMEFASILVNGEPVDRAQVEQGQIIERA